MPASYTIRRSVPRNTRRSKPASTPSTCFPRFSINLFMAFPLPRGDLSSNTTNIIREQETPSPFGCGYAALCNRYESRFSRMYERAYRTLRELQKQAAEPRKQKAEPEPPEPPKPNGGIQIATAPEGAQPSEPETKNKEANPSPTPVAHALLRAVSRLFATPLSVARSLANRRWNSLLPVQPPLSFLGWGAIPGQLHR